MKAVLLAGGHGNRLSPFTSYCNKHLLPIYNDQKPIIEHAIKNLLYAYTYIRDVAIVLGDKHCEDIFSYLKDGRQYSMNFSYYYQGEPKGIAQAVTCTQNFLEGEDDFLVYLADNFFSEGINAFTKRSTIQLQSAYLLFAKALTPERFGCPKIVDGIITYIKEKPKKAESNLALTGCYIFNTDDYFEYYNQLKPSKRGEYELTDLINLMIKDKKQVFYEIYDGFWSDMGTYESIKEVEKYLDTNTCD